MGASVPPEDFPTSHGWGAGGGVDLPQLLLPSPQIMLRVFFPLKKEIEFLSPVAEEV